MRTTVTRRTSAIVLAGLLALGGAACEGDDGGVIEENGGIVEETGGIVEEEPADTGANETDDGNVVDEGEAEGDATETSS